MQTCAIVETEHQVQRLFDVTQSQYHFATKRQHQDSNPQFFDYVPTTQTTGPQRMTETKIIERLIYL